MKRIIDVSGELYSFCKNLVAEDEMARVIYFSTPLHEVKSEDCVSKEYLKQSMLNMGWKHPDCTITEFVEGLPSAYPKSDKSSGEWIPVNNPYTELPKKDLWVTRSDNGNLCVDRIYYDMTEWSDFIGDVVAYMEYKEPAPFKSVDELKEDVYSRAYGLGYYDCFKKFVAKEPEDNSERIDTKAGQTIPLINNTKGNMPQDFGKVWPKKIIYSPTMAP